MTTWQLMVILATICGAPLASKNALAILGMSYLVAAMLCMFMGI